MPKITTAVFAGGTTLLIAGAAVAATLSPSGARMLHMADAHPASTASSLAPTTTPAPSSTSIPVPPTSPVTTPGSKAPTPQVKTTSSTTHASTPARKAAAKAPITYTVHRGDTLTGIAAWFKLHGYGSLYAANAKTIGANPNLIHPGERITIGSHVMKVQGPA